MNHGAIERPDISFPSEKPINWWAWDKEACYKCRRMIVVKAKSMFEARKIAAIELQADTGTVSVKMVS